MKLSVKGVSLTCAVLWGLLAMLVTGLVHLARPGYGNAFLELMASVYPGYHASASFGDVIVGTLYGLLDGGVGGAIFALLYNRFSG